eukprot:COSAG01_NODE_3099_length_6589_cov_2.308783_5_plen_83_part_00
MHACSSERQTRKLPGRSSASLTQNSIHARSSSGSGSSHEIVQHAAAARAKRQECVVRNAYVRISQTTQSELQPACQNLLAPG